GGRGRGGPEPAGSCRAPGVFPPARPASYRRRDTSSVNWQLTPGGGGCGAQYLAAGTSLLTRPLGTVRGGTAMRQIRMTKRRRPDDWRLEPLPLDLRDPDVVRAKELDRRTRTATLRPGRVERPGR